MWIYVDFCWTLGFKLGAKNEGWRGVEGMFFVLGPIWLRKVLVLAQALEFVEAQASLKEGVWGRMGRRVRRIRTLFGAILVLSWCFVGPFFDHVVAIASGSIFCRFWSCFMLIYVDFCWVLGFKLGAKSGGWRGVEGIFSFLGPSGYGKCLCLHKPWSL